jgi:hypothetical protein
MTYFATLVLFLIFKALQNVADRMNERQRSSSESSSESVKLDDLEEKAVQYVASTFNLTFK